MSKVVDGRERGEVAAPPFDWEGRRWAFRRGARSYARGGVLSEGAADERNAE